MSDPINPVLKTCPRCGLQFECLHAGECWCFKYSISPGNAEKLRIEFNNCLCPECLSKFAEIRSTQKPER
ncbi:MAG: cysteine-rich CWC family protein [Lentimicrobium sp.]